MIYTKRGWKDITDNSEYRQVNISISNALLTLSLSTLQNAPIAPEMRQLGEDITKLLSGK